MNEHPQTLTSSESTSSPSALRAYLEDCRQELCTLLAIEGSAGVVLARRHAELMDALVQRLHAAALQAPGTDPRARSVLLGAVGGYGRQLLGWKSDLDVRFVTRDAPETIEPFVEAVLYPLWDAGVSIGHQVTTLDDAVEGAANDLPGATALLDLRPLAGDRGLLQALRERAFAGVFSELHVSSFLTELEAASEMRHTRYGDSIYLLEPDVKNGTGGLRDLDLALWAAGARFRSGVVTRLAELDVLTPRQAEQTRQAVDFLWTVRNHLHQRAGRRCDRLTFADQETLARALGYERRIGELARGPEAHALGAMVEAFMSDYYLHARAITHVSRQILGRAKRRTARVAARVEELGQGLFSCEGGVGISDPCQLKTDPALALRLYAAALTREMPVLGRSRDAVAAAVSDASVAQALRASPEANALFVKLASSCRAAPFRHDSILAELHDVGLLVAMIPEFAPVVGRVHHDVYHVYTVDVHSVAATDRLRALMRGDLAKVHPLATRLAAEVERPGMLLLATLLHDVGKAIGGTDHARRGALMAREILARLGLPAQDIDDACHLIDKHLALYLVAVRRDLGDPATIAAFAREVETRAGLRDLYLLTVADLATTGPTAMTKWKAGMLDALLRATEAFFAGHPDVDPSRVARLRVQVRQHWSTDADPRFLEEFIGTMPERYLLAHTPAEIAAHARVAMYPRSASVAAALVPCPDPEVAELCVVTDGPAETGLCVVAGDRPGLLASIAAAISANKLEIHAAQIQSRALPEGGVQAVDLFWVRSVAGGHEHVAERLPRLEADLREVISGHVAPRDLLGRPSSPSWSERPMPAVFTEVMFDHRASERHTVIEVVTKDSHGLLFTLAQVLHELGITITIAKINTEGSRAIDVFYVTENDGRKLDPGARSEQVHEALCAALGASALRNELSVSRPSRALGATAA